MNIVYRVILITVHHGPAESAAFSHELFKTGTPPLKWASMAEYGTHLKTIGITPTLSTLAGHGTTRASVGAKTWKTFDRAMALIDRAVAIVWGGIPFL